MVELILPSNFFPFPLKCYTTQEKNIFYNEL